MQFGIINCAEAFFMRYGGTCKFKKKEEKKGNEMLFFVKFKACLVTCITSSVEMQVLKHSKCIVH